MEQSSTYRAIVAKGKLQGVRTMLLLQGRKRFGPPDAATTGVVESVTDLNQLEQLGERLLDVASWEELLGSPV